MPPSDPRPSTTSDHRTSTASTDFGPRKSQKQLEEDFIKAIEEVNADFIRKITEQTDTTGRAVTNHQIVEKFLEYKQSSFFKLLEKIRPLHKSLIFL